MKAIILISSLLFCVGNITAQGLAKKIRKTNSSVDSTNASLNNTAKTVNGTSSTITTTASAFKNLGSTLFGSHKNDKVKEGNITKDATEYSPIIINISGINYSKLELTQDSIQAIKGVKSADMTFKTSGSTISVLYAGKPSQLWHRLSSSVKDMFDVQAEDTNSITVQYKKK